MSAPDSKGLGIETITDLGQRVFGARRETVQEAARRYDLATLCSALLATLDATNDLIVDLPPGSAFLPQPDEFDGSDVWSAGEIVGHLVAMELASLPYWELVLGSDLSDPPPVLIEASEHPPTERPGCLEVLGSLRVRSAETLGAVAQRCDGEELAMHFALGHASVRAVLLGGCMHLVEHYHQLRALDT